MAKPQSAKEAHTRGALGTPTDLSQRRRATFRLR